jgi:LEA14-like dessication related protein
MRLAKLTSVLPLILLSLACSSIKQPTASFKTAEVTGITPQGFTMNFGLDLANPNPVALPLSQTNYKLGIGGQTILEGKANPQGTLPANGSLPLTLPVSITFDNLLAAKDAIAKGGGTIPYSFTGGIDVSNGAAKNLLGSSTTIPLKYEGKMDLTKLLQDPEVLMKSPAAKKLATSLLGSYLSR